MKHLYVIALFAAVCLLGSCDKLDFLFDRDKDGKTLNAMDKTFMTKVAIGNVAEIGAGQLAAIKGNNPLVRSYGQLMVVEHTTAHSELKLLGMRVNYPVSDTLDAEHRALLQQLNSLSGRAFDSVYMRSQVMDHQKTHAIFQQELSSGKHPDVKSYAMKFEPNIRTHLQLADSIARRL